MVIVKFPFFLLVWNTLALDSWQISISFSLHFPLKSGCINSASLTRVSTCPAWPSIHRSQCGVCLQQISPRGLFVCLLCALGTLDIAWVFKSSDFQKNLLLILPAYPWQMPSKIPSRCLKLWMLPNPAERVCLSFVSVAVLLWYFNTRGVKATYSKKEFIWLKIPGNSSSLWEHPGRSLDHLITSTVKSEERRRHAHCLNSGHTPHLNSLGPKPREWCHPQWMGLPSLLRQIKSTPSRPTWSRELRMGTPFLDHSML